MAWLKVSFLDVGHGDFIYAETPLGDNLVIDVGTGDVMPYKFLSNVSTISELQVSHPHTDHFDDIVAMSEKTIKSFRCVSLDKFADDKIGWKKSDKKKIAKLRELRTTTKADNAAVSVGNGFSHTVWYPDNVDTNDPNTASLITTLSYQGVKILFGADLPAKGWEELLKKDTFVNAISGTSILKASHHGRKEGCSKELFDVISPMLCIISDKSLDKDNKNTTATNWYTERSTGCNIVGYTDQKKVLSTRANGSICITVNEKGEWWVYPNTTWRA